MKSPGQLAYEASLARQPKNLAGLRRNRTGRELWEAQAQAMAADLAEGTGGSMP